MAILLFSKKKAGSGGLSLPDQNGNNGKFLKTNGSVLSWGTVNSLQSVSGTTSVNYMFTFSLEGILRDALFSSTSPVTFTLRINENPDTDISIETNGVNPLAHIINTAVFPGSKIEILNPSATLNFSFYFI